MDGVVLARPHYRRRLPWHPRARLDGQIYEKLFAALNLLTPPGRPYRPVWSARQYRRLRAVMLDAVRVIGTSLEGGVIESATLRGRELVGR